MNTNIDLSTFFLSIASAAYMGLGVNDPLVDEKAEINLDMAKNNIHLLELLFEKTAGNRTAEEDKLIEHLLYEVRMKFISVQNSLKKSV